jgi:hypothetical protein
VLETVPRNEDSNWRRVGKVQPKPALAWHIGLSGTPGWLGVNWLLSGKEKGDVAINHRIVRWCTGLSGEPTTPAANGRSRDQRATCGRANCRLGTSYCPVCTGQCPVRQPAPRLNGRQRPIWKEIAHRTATVAVRWCTGLSSAPLDRRQELPAKLMSNGS